jgi:hypothetical protein
MLANRQKQQTCSRSTYVGSLDDTTCSQNWFSHSQRPSLHGTNINHFRAPLRDTWLLQRILDFRDGPPAESLSPVAASLCEGVVIKLC